MWPYCYNKYDYRHCSNIKVYSTMVQSFAVILRSDSLICNWFGERSNTRKWYLFGLSISLFDFFNRFHFYVWQEIPLHECNEFAHIIFHSSQIMIRYSKSYLFNHMLTLTNLMARCKICLIIVRFDTKITNSSFETSEKRDS